MQFIGLRHLLPKQVRVALRGPWNRLLGWEQHLREKHFYRQFVTRGDLVFDVGAHMGVKTCAFLSLGARVIAVEANPVCAEYIRTAFRRSIASGQLELESSAVASENGSVELTIFDSESAMTSGSSEFLEYARLGGFEGSRVTSVSAVTLDSLIRKFGLPRFLKVDIEGMDADVLRGLSQRPQYLSFEYYTNAPLWQNTRECFRHAARLGFTEANVTEQVRPELLLRAWLPLDDAMAHLENLGRTRHCWGDVIVR